MTDLFISDLHLSPERPSISRAFFDFLETKAATANRLFILGDLMEAWIGDDDPTPHSREVINALARLSRAGTRLYFQHGNRDFLIGKRFAAETGATLLPTYHLLDSGQSRILLCHGDTLCTDDISYQRFRRMVRNPMVCGILRRLPLRKRQQLAENWRKKSIASKSNKAANIMDVNLATVDRVMAQFGADTLIHGHTHRPGTHNHGNGRQRLVLGDWDDKGWLIEAQDTTPTLHSFQIDSQSNPTE